jgi:hypothetical protein
MKIGDEVIFLFQNRIAIFVRQSVPSVISHEKNDHFGETIKFKFENKFF